MEKCGKWTEKNGFSKWIKIGCFLFQSSISHPWLILPIGIIMINPITVTLRVMRNWSSMWCLLIGYCFVLFLLPLVREYSKCIHASHALQCIRFFLYLSIDIDFIGSTWINRLKNKPREHFLNEPILKSSNKKQFQCLASTKEIHKLSHTCSSMMVLILNCAANKWLGKGKKKHTE